MTVIDGFNLDQRIEGFETLNVAGRELIGREVVTRKYSSFNVGGKSRTRTRQGAIMGANRLISSDYPSRILTIEYRLSAKTDRDARALWEKLNYHINREGAEIYFTDELEYSYIGTLISAEEVPSYTNTVISSFNIECFNPFKTKRLEQVFKFTNQGQFMLMTLYPVLPLRIKVKPKAPTSILRIENLSNGLFLQLDRHMSSDQEITFDFENARVLNHLNQDVTKDLYILSDLEDFEVLQGDILKTNVNADCEFYFKRRVL